MKKKLISLLLCCALAFNAIAEDKKTLKDHLKNAFYITGTILAVAIIKSLPEIIKALNDDPQETYEKAVKAMEQEQDREKNFIQIGPNIYMSKELYYTMQMDEHKSKLRQIENKYAQKR